MTLAELQGLDIGDEVFFEPTDPAYAPGHYIILEIVSDSGTVETDATPLVLDDKDGGVVEVFAKEIR